MTGVMVTRPAHQADGQAAELMRRGYTPILAPCLELRIERGPPLDDAGVAAFAVSSANGVAALARRMTVRDKPLFTVGAATADAAREAGFSSIESAEGDGPALADLIVKRVGPGAGSVLYACGEDTAYDLRAALEASSISCLQVTVYAMSVAASLPAAALQALEDSAARAVLLMSARTAEAFAELVAASGRSPAMKQIAAVCLSDQVAVIARAHDFREIAVAAKPTQPALLETLAAVAPAGR